MKRFMMAAIAASMFAPLAYAADLGSQPTQDSLYAEPAQEQPTYAFAGFAIGIDGGGQFNAWDINGDFCGPVGPCVSVFDFDGISSDGLIGGVHLQYLFAIDRSRFGVYAEGGFSNVNTTLEFYPGPGFSAEFQQDSYYGAGLKAGFTVFGDTLAFVRAGYDRSQWTFSASGFGDEDVDVGSWLVGAGIDTMMSDHVSLGLGVDVLMVDDVEAAGKDFTKFVEDSEMIRAKARLSYHF